MQLVQKTNSIMNFTDFDSCMKWATVICKSELCPTTYRGKPENILVAIEYGRSLGLNTLQCLSNISVINGRPSIWGDAMLSLAINHPLYEYHEETQTSTAARCVVKKKNLINPIVSEFTIENAKTAGLLTKAGPWITYPERMLKMRARGFALRDAFPDMFSGLVVKEEAEDSEKLILSHKNIETNIINGDLVRKEIEEESNIDDENFKRIRKASFYGMQKFGINESKILDFFHKDSIQDINAEDLDHIIEVGKSLKAALIEPEEAFVRQTKASYISSLLDEKTEEESYDQEVR